jgi:cytochrome P450
MNGPSVYGFFHAFEPVLFINDPEIVQEMYTTQNKYFDKHPYIKNLFAPLMGEGLIFDRSNERWAKKRKALSITFYKDRMLKMQGNIIGHAQKAAEHWRTNFSATGQPMNIVEEVSNIKV